MLRLSEIIICLWGIAGGVFVFSQESARLADDFEAGFALWEARGESPPVITTAQKESLGDFSNATRFVMFPSKDKGSSALELPEVFPREDSRLVFYVKTELVPLAQAKFALYVDGKEVFSRQGISEWRQQYVTLAAGRHSIRFEVKKTTASFGAGISNAVFLDNIFLSPEPAPPASLHETFDGDVSFGAPDSLWLGNAALVSNAPAELKNDSGFIRLNVPPAQGSSTFEITRVAPEINSSLSFRFKTEIAGAASQSFKVYLDNKEMGSWEGVGMMWRTESILVPAGIHAVRFEAASKGKSVQGGYNAVFIDDVMLISDETAFIRLEPLGELQTYAGSAADEKIVFTARAFRKDNSLKEKSGAQKQAADFAFAAHDVSQPNRVAAGAEIDKNGVFSARVPGKYIVTASKDGHTVASGVITVHEADYLFKPFFYSGTGKTYQGFTGGGAGNAISQTPALQIVEPRFLSFEADGFFTLQGKITKPSAKNYAHINVAKIENGRQTFSTYYIVHDFFTERIWLPFGKGEYAVTITVLETVRLTTPPGGAEGDFRGGSYMAQTLTLTVRNTRDEQEIDGDGRWIYPSWRCQSDDFMIANMLEHILRESGAKTEHEKAKAIHDSVVKLLAYDSDSFRNDSRARKADAVAALQNRTAVCEGYSYLCAALFRAAGIPAKMTGSRAINHVWNNVFIDGAWRFFDATWDDPSPDKGPYFVDYTYFLLDSLTGGDNRHRGNGTALIGDVSS